MQFICVATQVTCGSWLQSRLKMVISIAPEDPDFGDEPNFTQYNLNDQLRLNT